ncbi:prolyl oligopeptidase family serine peptidase [Chitinophaga sp. G-6-1-13]|uniref:Prolyl oligopeptidase family serine peptidase n=1 Tax=Chitinophaga fulva TaxID=2728842 RepID=A0A848GPU9_9BACT|nr:prolyl oligopeptidase family serine peptidase [Chitinophaga fulva]NML39062.1 prolyl oligopeptidase family serine peptidase [Chitinophaga fulva]
MRAVVLPEDDNVMNYTKKTHTAFLSLCCVLTCLSLSAQRNMDSVLVTTSQWKKVGALIHLPEDYYLTTKDYPVIICLHGKSKAGADLKRLTLEGVPYWLNNGARIQAKNPADGKLYKFIVVAPQASSWGLKPAEINSILDDVEKRYRIDKSRIYITGYSAGGWATVMALTDSRKLTSRIAAAVPMSVASIDKKNEGQFKLVADASVHCWYFAGSDELHFLEECQRYVDSTNKYQSGLAQISVIPDFGHHSWKQLYDPRYRNNGMNIYEWMLQYRQTGKMTAGGK